MLLSLLQKRSKHSGQLAAVLALVIIPLFAAVSGLVDAHGASEQSQMVQMAESQAAPCEADLACL